MTHQLNLGLCRSAMLHHIPQSLLRDPIQAQSHILRDLFRNAVMDKFNLQVVPIGEFSAEALDGCYRAHKVEQRGPQPVRQIVDTRRNFSGYFGEAVELCSSLGRQPRSIATKLREADLQQRHPLVQIVA